MSSVTASGSEEFGRYVVDVNISVALRNGDSWLCCGWKYLRLFWGGKEAQYLRWMGEMVPGIGGHFGALGVVKEIRRPCGGRDFLGV